MVLALMEQTSCSKSGHCCYLCGNVAFLSRFKSQASGTPVETTKLSSKEILADAIKRRRAIVFVGAGVDGLQSPDRKHLRIATCAPERRER
jgi:hypothetical protein